ncbi:hypothetical protein PR048_005859 [Dryococelus australis]|uniref:Uncharacterized protein n=1 Tax=Dryococelus australis TaxID=614101 RepID=A0ABQ9I9C7_9NEOP|nr:hypothetical protein PR048_005859 [Dryococelus australis]
MHALKTQDAPVTLRPARNKGSLYEAPPSSGKEMRVPTFTPVCSRAGCYRRRNAGTSMFLTRSAPVSRAVPSATQAPAHRTDTHTEVKLRGGSLDVGVPFRGLVARGSGLLAILRAARIGWAVNWRATYQQLIGLRPSHMLLSSGVCLWRYRQNGARGGVVVRLLASHIGEPGLIPGAVASGFPNVGIVPDDAAGRLVFSGISRFPRPCISAPHHTHLNSPSSALKPPKSLHSTSEMNRLASNSAKRHLSVTPGRHCTGRRYPARCEDPFATARILDLHQRLFGPDIETNLWETTLSSDRVRIIDSIRIGHVVNSWTTERSDTQGYFTTNTGVPCQGQDEQNAAITVRTYVVLNSDTAAQLSLKCTRSGLPVLHIGGQLLPSQVCMTSNSVRLREGRPEHRSYCRQLKEHSSPHPVIVDCTRATGKIGRDVKRLAASKRNTLNQFVVCHLGLKCIWKLVCRGTGSSRLGADFPKVRFHEWRHPAISHVTTQACSFDAYLRCLARVARSSGDMSVAGNSDADMQTVGGVGPEETCFPHHILTPVRFPHIALAAFQRLKRCVRSCTTKQLSRGRVINARAVFYALVKREARLANDSFVRAAVTFKSAVGDKPLVTRKSLILNLYRTSSVKPSKMHLGQFLHTEGSCVGESVARTGLEPAILLLRNRHEESSFPPTSIRMWSCELGEIMSRRETNDYWYLNKWDISGDMCEKHTSEYLRVSCIPLQKSDNLVQLRRATRTVHKCAAKCMEEDGNIFQQLNGCVKRADEYRPSAAYEPPMTVKPGDMIARPPALFTGMIANCARPSGGQQIRLICLSELPWGTRSVRPSAPRLSLNRHNAFLSPPPSIAACVAWPSPGEHTAHSETRLQQEILRSCLKPNQGNQPQENYDQSRAKITERRPTRKHAVQHSDAIETGQQNLVYIHFTLAVTGISYRKKMGLVHNLGESRSRRELRAHTTISVAMTASDALDALSRARKHSLQGRGKIPTNAISVLKLSGRVADKIITHRRIGATTCALWERALHLIGYFALQKVPHMPDCRLIRRLTGADRCRERVKSIRGVSGCFTSVFPTTLWLGYFTEEESEKGENDLQVRSGAAILLELRRQSLTKTKITYMLFTNTVAVASARQQIQQCSKPRMQYVEEAAMLDFMELLKKRNGGKKRKKNKRTLERSAQIHQRSTSSHILQASQYGFEPIWASSTAVETAKVTIGCSLEMGPTLDSLLLAAKYSLLAGLVNTLEGDYWRTALRQDFWPATSSCWRVRLESALQFDVSLPYPCVFCVNTQAAPQRQLHIRASTGCCSSLSQDQLACGSVPKSSIKSGGEYSGVHMRAKRGKFENPPTVTPSGTLPTCENPGSSQCEASAPAFNDRLHPFDSRNLVACLTLEGRASTHYSGDNPPPVTSRHNQSNGHGCPPPPLHFGTFLITEHPSLHFPAVFVHIKGPTFVNKIAGRPVKLRQSHVPRQLSVSRVEAKRCFLRVPWSPLSHSPRHENAEDPHTRNQSRGNCMRGRCDVASRAHLPWMHKVDSYTETKWQFPFMWAYPFPDRLREALRVSPVSDWLLHARERFLICRPASKLTGTDCTGAPTGCAIVSPDVAIQYGSLIDTHAYAGQRLHFGGTCECSSRYKRLFHICILKCSVTLPQLRIVARSRLRDRIVRGGWGGSDVASRGHPDPRRGSTNLIGAGGEGARLRDVMLIVSADKTSDSSRRIGATPIPVSRLFTTPGLRSFALAGPQPSTCCAVLLHVRHTDDHFYK